MTGFHCLQGRLAGFGMNLFLYICLRKPLVIIPEEVKEAEWEQWPLFSLLNETSCFSSPFPSCGYSWEPQLAPSQSLRKLLLEPHGRLSRTLLYPRAVKFLQHLSPVLTIIVMLLTGQFASHRSVFFIILKSKNPVYIDYI